MKSTIQTWNHWQFVSPSKIGSNLKDSGVAKYSVLGISPSRFSVLDETEEEPGDDDHITWDENLEEGDVTMEERNHEEKEGLKKVAE